tara:strand:- start:409 stop:723 length:315 start_codon:yes stop_codon:yes gene_type:complete
MSEMIKDLKEVYDVEACKYILEHGCVSGAASSHIYYSQTNSFYDRYEEEIVELVMNTMGDNYPACIFVENEYSIVGYKNAMSWIAIESYAFDVCDEELMKERII